jgi:hypothetical protein
VGWPQELRETRIRVIATARADTVHVRPLGSAAQIIHPFAELGAAVASR